MSQNDFEVANQGFPSFRADMNSALQALATNSSGTTEPSTTRAYQFWYDETADLLKMRNGDDDAWITLAFFDQTNDEWEVRTAVIQAVDGAGVVIKTDDGTTRVTVADNGNVTVTNQLTVSDGLIVDNDGATVATFDRATSDGPIVDLQKNGSSVGEIGVVDGDDTYITGDNCALRFGIGSSAAKIVPCNSDGSVRDGVITLGDSAARFKDLYLSGGVYLGGTGAANYLDDYEVGSWTPATSGHSGGISSTISGKYVKVGDFVMVTGVITRLSGSVTSVLQVTNLPFTPNEFGSVAVDSASDPINVDSGRLASGITSFNCKLNGVEVGSGTGALNLTFSLAYYTTA